MTEHDPQADSLAGAPAALDSAPHGAHEPDSTARRPIAIGALALGVLLLLGVLVPTLLQKFLLAREARLSPPANPLVESATSRVPPAPRLQVNPWRDIAELRSSEDAILQSYGWVDQKAGVVRIPIDRAIDLVAHGTGSAGAPAAESQR